MTMPVAITGRHGFLGWHTRASLLETSTPSVAVALGDGFDLAASGKAIDGSSRLIHIAGVNRGSDDEVVQGNVLFAKQLASAIRAVEVPPPVVVFANSSQSLEGTAYGEAKKRAAAILADAAAAVGVDFVDVILPNLFGEHGRPFYNAVTSTFCHLLAAGDEPTVQSDKELTLLHAQNAADLLTGVTEDAAGLEVRLSVSGMLARLKVIADTYRVGDIPDVSDAFSRDLFNTYRSFTFPQQAPIALKPHADARGSFFEIIRSHGGDGQSSFSTTLPGIARGDHFHRRKIERFTVLSGRGTISLRRVFTDEVVSFVIDGDAPAAVDMPTMWSHNITNTSDETLYTSFWTNDIFDPARPDTIAETVYR